MTAGKAHLDVEAAAVPGAGGDRRAVGIGRWPARWPGPAPGRPGRQDRRQSAGAPDPRGPEPLERPEEPVQLAWRDRRDRCCAPTAPPGRRASVRADLHPAAGRVVGPARCPPGSRSGSQPACGSPAARGGLPVRRQPQRHAAKGPRDATTRGRDRGQVERLAALDAPLPGRQGEQPVDEPLGAALPRFSTCSQASRSVARVGRRIGQRHLQTGSARPPAGCAARARRWPRSAAGPGTTAPRRARQLIQRLAEPGELVLAPPPSGSHRLRLVAEMSRAAAVIGPHRPEQPPGQQPPGRRATARPAPPGSPRAARGRARTGGWSPAVPRSRRAPVCI